MTQLGINLSIDMESMRKCKIFLATPMYGGSCEGIFAKSVADLSASCAQKGIGLVIHFLMNESLIPRARNYCVDAFMRSDCTHLMFVDADIGFNADDVLALLAFSIQNNGDNPYDIIGGAYPKKNISWEKVLAAANKGYGDVNPNNLENYVGDFVFNPLPGTSQIKLNEPAEVLEIGTGFMLARRETFVKFQQEYQQYLYRPDHVRDEHFDGKRKIMMFFQSEIDPVSERYLSEDYWFTQMARKIGLRTWLCPWMGFGHAGKHIYSGSILNMAQIGQSATADQAVLDKIKQSKK